MAISKLEKEQGSQVTGVVSLVTGKIEFFQTIAKLCSHDHIEGYSSYMDLDD